MKTTFSYRPALQAGICILLLAGCATKPPQQAAPAGKVAMVKTHDGKTVSGADEYADYQNTAVADPLEPVNRVTFWINDQLYTFILRPVSKTYEFVVPKLLRKGIFNVYDNAEFPIRFVNNALQGNIKRVGQETGKFVVNSIGGVGGIWRLSDHFPQFADVPKADTAQTFAKWGIGNGAYFVIPILGPSTLRDAVGVAGDYALDPVTWVTIYWGGNAWIIAVSAPDTARAIPPKLARYDAATNNSIDKYLAARSAYIQYRNEMAHK